MQLGVLWDLDGVLADSGAFHIQSWHDTLIHYGIDLAEEAFRATFGMNNTTILKLAMHPEPSQALIDQISNEKEALFRRLIVGKLQPLAGGQALLAELRTAGFLQAIGSSAPQENIDAEIDAIGVRPYFDAIVSAARLPGKPSPVVYQTAAAQLGLPPERCLVIEDAIAGVQAARNAGMRCLAVTNTNPAAALADADRVVDSLEEVSAEMIREMLK